MSQGYAGYWADVIDDQYVNEIAPEELATLESLVSTIEPQTGDNPWSDIAATEEDTISADDKPPQAVLDAMDALRRRFKDKTGLDLYIGFHDAASNGDLYGSVDGRFFHVGNAYVESEELKAARAKYGVEVERRTWVVYG